MSSKIESAAFASKIADSRIGLQSAGGEIERARRYGLSTGNVESSDKFSGVARALFLCGSLATTYGVHAQSPTNTARASASELALEEVVVTGSRTITNGNDSPTPVTVVTVADLQATHPATVFEALLDMPAFAGSRGGTSSNPSGATGVNGAGNNQVSALNLRGLGPARSLLLYDGHRLPPTQQDGFTNANTVPQMLLQRVDIATGGASAAYGSDAIGGVVNFITDRKFNGVKLEAQTGISELGDARTNQLGFALGTDLFGGRGHIEGSAQTLRDDGLRRMDRHQFDGRWTVQGSGNAALPYFLVANATISSSTFGGKILGPAANPTANVNNPLRNYQFATNGVLSPFVNGSTTGIAGTVSQIGGDGAYHTGSTLKSKSTINQLYGRFDFDITDDLHYYASISSTLDHAFSYGGNNGLANVTLRATNAFLSPTYQSQMTTAMTPAGTPAGITTFTFSKTFGPASLVPISNADFYSRELYINTGLEGKLGEYNWDVSYTHADVKLDARNNGATDNGRLAAALDAVRDTSGNIVCNVAITNPGLYPGCVPLNVFGPSSESQAGIDYIYQKRYYLTKLPMDDVAGTITGAPFNNWVGPVNMALSAEWRRQGMEVTSTAWPVNYDPLNCTGLPLNCIPVGSIVNGSPSLGTARLGGGLAPRPSVSMTVSEAALETDLPLLKDLPLAQAADLNLAYRYAKYSATGNTDLAAPRATHTFNANTWKVGLDWHFSDAVTLRATRSRDIRAPNLYDLFQANTVGAGGGFRDFLTNQTTTPSGQAPEVVTGGNSNLSPEVASTTTVGLVFKPTDQLSLSVDAFDIRIKDFIVRLNGYDVTAQNACYAGSAYFCSLQERPFPITNTTPANAVTRWYALPVNVAKMTTRGLDIEANYKNELFGHPFSLRGLVTYQPHLLYFQPGAVTQDLSGLTAGGLQAGPKLRVSAFAHFAVTDNFAIDWMTRWRDTLKHNQDASLIALPNTDAHSVAFSSLNLSYRLSGPFAGRTNVYLNVQNVFNQSAPITATQGANTIPGQFGGFAFGDDVVGRYYSVGFRYRL